MLIAADGNRPSKLADDTHSEIRRRQALTAFRCNRYGVFHVHGTPAKFRMRHIDIHDHALEQGLVGFILRLQNYRPNIYLLQVAKSES